MLKVINLIDLNTKSWKISLIAANFPPIDGYRIMSLPLVPEPCEDILPWLPLADDKFSIKSA